METKSNGRGSALIRLKAAAARLGVSVRTLYRDVADGKLTLVHVRGCSCIEETELENYIKRRGMAGVAGPQPARCGLVGNHAAATCRAAPFRSCATMASRVISRNMSGIAVISSGMSF